MFVSTSDSIIKSFVLNNQYGLHARPASILVKELQKHDVEVEVKSADTTVNGKSILELMMLAANPGETLTFQIKGNDASAAMAAVEKLFETNFGGH